MNINNRKKKQENLKIIHLTYCNVFFSMKKLLAFFHGSNFQQGRQKCYNISMYCSNLAAPGWQSFSHLYKFIYSCKSTTRHEFYWRITYLSGRKRAHSGLIFNPSIFPVLSISASMLSYVRF